MAACLNDADKGAVRQALEARRNDIRRDPEMGDTVEYYDRLIATIPTFEICPPGSAAPAVIAQGGSSSAEVEVIVDGQLQRPAAPQPKKQKKRSAYQEFLSVCLRSAKKGGQGKSISECASDWKATKATAPGQAPHIELQTRLPTTAPAAPARNHDVPLHAQLEVSGG